MSLVLYVCSLFALLYLPAVLASPMPELPQLHNANHIFNAIHSSMRQWGSSLHHNGMSYFIATVPAGTQLYHGQRTDADVMGTDWLAFEPEHALMFAYNIPRSPPSDGLPPHDWPEDGERARSVSKEKAGQAPLSPDDCLGCYQGANSDRGEIEMPPRGFLDTYNTKRDLKFLYIDGMSAGDPDKGSADSQDYVLLPKLDKSDPMMLERLRAKGMCKLLQEEWASGLAGVIRMEAGFEIIMCSFEDTLDLAYRTAVVDHPEDRMLRVAAQHFSYMRNFQSRSHGIGGGRVELDYDRMVTAYRYVDVAPSNDQHRLNATATSTLSKIREELRQAIPSHEAEVSQGHRIVNWQLVADMIVTRYSDWLQYVTSAEVAGHKARFEAEIEAILLPFLNKAKPDASLEALRCSRQFLVISVSAGPEEKAFADERSPSIAQVAVANIAQKICNTIVNVHRGDGMSLVDRVRTLRDLIEYLQWTTFKQCRGCTVNEVCMVAAFPFGAREDHFHPSCKNTSTAGWSHEYWQE